MKDEYFTKMVEQAMSVIHTEGITLTAAQTASLMRSINLTLRDVERDARPLAYEKVIRCAREIVER